MLTHRAGGLDLDLENPVKAAHEAGGLHRFHNSFQHLSRFRPAHQVRSLIRNEGLDVSDFKNLRRKVLTTASSVRILVSINFALLDPVAITKKLGTVPLVLYNLIIFNY
jgi:hypothetical protein